MQPLPPPAEADASLPYDISNLRNYSLAVSGDVFRWIIEFGSEDVLKRVISFSISDHMSEQSTKGNRCLPVVKSSHECRQMKSTNWWRSCRV